MKRIISGMETIITRFMLLLILLILFSAFSLAENCPDVSISIEPEVVRIQTTQDGDAAAGYIHRILYPVQLREPLPSGYSLEGANRYLYDQLRSGVVAAAAGERSEVIFSFPAEDVYEEGVFTAADLGVEAIFIKDENNERILNPEAQTAISNIVTNQFDHKSIIRCLLADCPYEMYWYDKTVGCIVDYPSVHYSISQGVEKATLSGNVTFSMAVSEEYRAEGVAPITILINGKTENRYCHVGTQWGQSVAAAVRTAGTIVNRYERWNDYERLVSYKDEIKALSEYNWPAANGQVSFGNPWQLIWVFDGDPATKVVCEGYSKAFQYLNDLSSSKVTAICVTGTMDGGPHMWNVVRMDDGQNYMADVTNCFTDEAGELHLFLDGYKSRDGDTYVFGSESRTSAYIYDEDNGVYTADELSVSDQDYPKANLLSWSDIRETAEGTETTVSIMLTGDITADDGQIRITDGKEVTLNLAGHTITSGETECFFLVCEGGKLTILDSAGGGKLTGTVNADSAIINQGTFILQGGSICDNHSVGVLNQSAGIFTMTGGSITGNEMTGVKNYGTFTMTGGNISGNGIAEESVDCESGVSAETSSIFEMTGGVISGNGLYGVFIPGDNACFRMKGGTISGHNYYGVSGCGVFEMTGGQITGNGQGVDAVTLSVQVGGMASVTGNGTAEVPWNLYLADGNPITVIDTDGGLAPEARIGVTINPDIYPFVFTAGATGQDGTVYAAADNFTADNQGQYIIRAQNGELGVDEAYIRIDKTNMRTGEIVTVTAHYPGADYIGIRSRSGNFWDYYFVSVQEGDTASWDIFFEEKGETILYPMGWTYDRWNDAMIPDPQDFPDLTSEAVHVTVNVSRVEHDDWEAMITPLMPESAVPGQDLTVTHIGVEGAVSYNVGVWGSLGTCEYYVSRTDPGRFVIPAAVLADGGVYNIGIGVADDSGYDDWCWKDFDYEVAPYENGMPLILSADEFIPGQETSFSFSVTDAECVIIQKTAYLTSYPPDIYEYWETFCVTDYPEQPVKVMLKDDETYMVRAAVKKNGVWSAWSNTVRLSVPDDLILKLPDSLQIIEEEAFAGINAVVVHVPDSCIRIESGAFRDCKALFAVYIPEGCIVADDAFENCNENLRIHRTN